MSSQKIAEKNASQKMANATSANAGPREPFLSRLSGAGVIVRFNSDWAQKCAKDDTFAAFVSLFDENTMPTVRPVVMNQADMGEMPDDLQAALITHAAKKFVDATANLMSLTEKLYQKYWMSLSIDWQQRLIATEGYAAIKANFDLQGLKTLLEATFANPSTGGIITRTAMENAMTSFYNSRQFDKETMAAYYKRFVQIVHHLNSVLDEPQRPSIEMQVTRYLSSLNARDGVYCLRLKERAALSGDQDDGFPVSLEDALAKGAGFLLEHYGSRNNHTNQVPQTAATVYAAEVKGTPGAGKGAPKPKKSLDLSHITCYKCGVTGHYRSDCTAKEVHSLVVSDWCGLCDDDADHDVLVCGDALPEAVCYSLAVMIRVKCDSCAEVCIVGEGFPLVNLRKCKPLIIKGINGSLMVTMVGSFGPLKNVFFHPEIPVNILALGVIERVATVKYTQNQGFEVRFNGMEGVFHFNKTNDNTFSCYFPAYSVMESTVADRERLYTKAEVLRARGVRELKRNLAGASDRDLNEFITSGVAVSCPYTLEDVRRATAIYGPDISCLKGKMTSPGPERPLVVRVNHGEQRQQELHIDIFEVSNVSFLLSVMLPMNYTFGTYLPGRSVEELTAAVSGLLRTIQSKGFIITKIVVDPEGGLDALKDTLPVPVNTNAPGTHVAHAERRNRTVKERMRVIISALPFRVAARFMKFLVFFIITRLGVIPRSTDGSRVCPRERFTGQKVVFNKELSLCFGDAVQIFSKPAVLNSMEERCFSAMALFPCGNDQGSWKFYKFSTGTIVSSNKWVKVPMQDLQIQLLNAMADEDGGELGRGRRARESMARVRTVPGQVPIERMLVNAHRPAGGDGFPDGTVVTVVEEAAAPVAAPEPQGDDFPQDLSDPESLPLTVPEEDTTKEVVTEELDDAAEETAQPLGSTWDGDVRVSARQAQRARLRQEEEASVYKLSVAQGIAKYGDMAKQATLDEFVQMREKAVLRLLLYADLSPAQRERIIHSSLFLKEKYDEAGELERIKARLVASGNEMDRDAYSPGSSPTVATEAVAILLAQSAAYNEVRYFVDIGTAFLEASMGDEEVYMWIGKSLVPFLMEAMPEAAQYVDHKGRVLVRLLKALYGCIQSSRLWFEHIRDILLRGGYRANEYDCCVFHKGELGNRCSAALHVDALFITASSEALAQELLNLLRANLKEVKVKSGRVNTYLGMRITETDTHLEADMDGYVHDCVEWSGVTGTAKTPADDDLFRVEEKSVTLGVSEHDRFHTGTAKLLFVAKRCRPAILTAINFLCSRVLSSTQQDASKLDRVLKYLRATPVQPIKYAKGTYKMDLFAYIDAGYGVHDTGESRSGLVVTLNGTPVLCKSMRQRIVTKSSTEAELVALSDGLTEVIWCREFIQSAGFVLPATGVGEDNTSVMSLLESRKFGTARTKHISVRYFFICDRIAKGELVMVYVPTKEQLADILSKALVGAQFHVLQPRLHGDIKV